MAYRLAEALRVMAAVWTDLVVLGLSRTNEIAHYHLVFGVLVWGAGMLAGFTVFGHRRPLDAVVVVGLAILANMAITDHDQLYLLVVFSAAALFLLIRTHVFEEEVTWARRKIGDPSVVGELYLVRGGTAFVAIAVVGSMLLTVTASSAPLQGLWSDLPRQLQDFAQFIQKIAPNGDGRNPGHRRLRAKRDDGRQVESQRGHGLPGAVRSGRGEPLQVARRHVRRLHAQRLGMGRGCRAARGRHPRPAAARRGQQPVPDDRVLRRPDAGRAPRGPVHRHDARLPRPGTIVGPNAIRTVDKPTDAIGIGADGWFTSIESLENADSYTVTALVPQFGTGAKPSPRRSCGPPATTTQRSS